MKQNQDGQPMLSDVATLRKRARQDIASGAVTAVFGALFMFTAGFVASPTKAEAPMQPSPS